MLLSPSTASRLACSSHLSCDILHFGEQLLWLEGLNEAAECGLYPTEQRRMQGLHWASSGQDTRTQAVAAASGMAMMGPAGRAVQQHALLRWEIHTHTHSADTKAEPPQLWPHTDPCEWCNCFIQVHAHSSSIPTCGQEGSGRASFQPFAGPCCWP